MIPRTQIRGLIEARTSHRKPATPPAGFRGLRSAASLKRPAHGRATRAARRFRGLRSAASLKLALDADWRREYWLRFRGLRSAASLKLALDADWRREYWLRFRGLRSAASLKHRLVKCIVECTNNAIPRTQIRGLIEACTGPPRCCSRCSDSADSDPRPH